MATALPALLDGPPEVGDPEHPDLLALDLHVLLPQEGGERVGRPADRGDERLGVGAVTAREHAQQEARVEAARRIVTEQHFARPVFARAHRSFHRR